MECGAAGTRNNISRRRALRCGSHRPRSPNTRGETLVTTPPELTYPGVLLAVFANQLCLPVPSILCLMAAGALSAHGRMSAAIIVLLAVLGCLAADGIWFWLGRQWGSNALRLFCRFSADPRKCSR